MKEMTRVLSPDGFLLIHEPTVSMGDWTKERKGITNNERGIPLNKFKEIIAENDLEIVSEHRTFFPLLRRIKLYNHYGSNSNFFVSLDCMLSKLFNFNNKYNPQNFFEKLGPQSVFYVLRKEKRNGG